MLTEAEARAFASDWIEAWNTHDLTRILSHYSSDIVFSSAFIAVLGADSSGSVCGREALRAYFMTALSKFPALEFRLRGVFRGVETLTLLYDSVHGRLAAETMVLDSAGQVTRCWAQYDDTRETSHLPATDT